MLPHRPPPQCPLVLLTEGFIRSCGCVRDGVSVPKSDASRCNFSFQWVNAGCIFLHKILDILAVAICTPHPSPPMPQWTAEYQSPPSSAGVGWFEFMQLSSCPATCDIA